MSAHDIYILVSDGTKHTIKEHIGSDETIKSFRKRICELLGVTDDMIRLIFGGKEIKQQSSRKKNTTKGIVSVTASNLKDIGIGKHGNWTVHCMIKPTASYKKQKAFVITDDIPNPKISVLTNATTPALVSTNGSNISNDAATIVDLTVDDAPIPVDGVTITNCSNKNTSTASSNSKNLRKRNIEEIEIL